MNFPKMIVFDYGHTLLYEPGFSTLRGEEALSRYYKVNPDNLTPGAVDTFSKKLFEELAPAREAGAELHEWLFQRLLYESLGIELSVSFPEAERIFWDAASYGAVMPGTETMLKYINARGIRSGVVSNISFSGLALAERINRLLPENRFEFIIASSEYVFRKPSRHLFELALRKAGLSPSDVWFCGDNVRADVEGAAAAGIFPVWYEEPSVENPWWRGDGTEPGFPHLHIRHWDEMTEVLEKLK